MARERQDIMQELFTVSWTFDIQEFVRQGVRLMLTARRLTIKLVKMVKEWKRMRIRATFEIQLPEMQKPLGLRSSSGTQRKEALER